MKEFKILVGFVIIVALLAAPVSAVFAAQDAITGTVQSITLETNTNTGVTTVHLTILDNDTTQIVRLAIDAAIEIGLVTLGGDGNPIINEAILGQFVEIDSTTIITDEQEKQHPVADALATFFADIKELDYATIISVHDQGTGFGVIAQALWMTRKMEGDVEFFLAIIDAKKNNDFSAFVLEDGSIPENWGQFKQAVLNGKQGKPSVTLMDSTNNGNGGGNENNGNPNNDNGNGKNKNKDKDRNNRENNNQRNNRDR